ncbi:MAG: hypothetical protein LQ338_005455 [Usnochroma carphineum]|nr:MAG: hypothetical protein LQ338_005455 [Usnochroma carphineum]
MAQRQPDHQGLANQGQPLGGPPEHSDGKKVTTDPASTKNPIHEPAGPVASDSLAAESTRSGGAFASNRGSAPLSVSGSSSTFNTTDVSGAQKLDPAPDAAAREAKEAWGEVPDEARGPHGQKYPEGAGEVKFPGRHNKDGYEGGSSDAKREVGAGHTHTSSGTRGDSTAAAAAGGGVGSGGTGTVDNSANIASSANAGVAPGYVASVVSEPVQSGKPHGKNITEGGFEADDGKNVSFNAEIGSQDDPGRAATEQFQTSAQTPAGPKGPRQAGITGDGQYDALETDQSL